MLEFKLLLLLLVANGAPIVTRKILGRRFNLPLDGGMKTSGGRRWLGPSKTLRGAISAVAATTLVSPLMGFSWGLGIIFGSLAMLGDLVASFIKRRLGLPSSSRANGLDQIPESLFPLLYCTVSLGLGCESLLLTVMAFWISGILISRVLYQIGVRRHPY